MENFTRENRLQESAIKIRKPFKIDSTLCIYSPQENVDSLNHPKIKSWQKFIQNERILLNGNSGSFGGKVKGWVEGVSDWTKGFF